MNILLKKNNIIFNIIYFLFPILIFYLNLVIRKINYLSVDQTRSIEWIRNFDFNTLNILKFIPYLINEHRFEGIFFLIPLNIYSFSLSINQDYWFVIVIFINFIFLLILLTLFYKFFQRLEYSNFLISLFPFILFLNNDLIIWSSYTLPDFFSFCFFGIVIYLLLNINKSKLNSLYLIFFVILFIFIRPTNFLIIFILTQFYFIYFTSKYFSYKLLALFFLFFYSSIIFFIISFFYLDYVPNLFQFLDDTFNYYRSYYLEGAVIHHRFYTYIDEPNTYFDYLMLVFCRLIYFFAFVSKEFSVSHNIYNLIYYIPMYFFCIIAFLKFNTLSDTEKNITFVMITIILTYAIFHSLTLIDYDWRYRINCNLCFSVLSFFGIKISLSKFSTTSSLIIK